MAVSRPSCATATLSFFAVGFFDDLAFALAFAFGFAFDPGFTVVGFGFAFAAGFFFVFSTGLIASAAFCTGAAVVLQSDLADLIFEGQINLQVHKSHNQNRLGRPKGNAVQGSSSSLSLVMDGSTLDMAFRSNQKPK